MSLRKKGEWQKVLPRYPGRYTHSGCFIFFYKFSPHFKINLHNYIWQRGQRDNDSAPWLPLHPPPGQPGFRPDDHSPLLSLGEGSSAHQPLLLLTSASSDLTLHDPRDYSPPGSSAQGILQATILEWVVISFSRGLSPTQGSHLGFWHLGLTKVWLIWLYTPGLVRGPECWHSSQAQLFGDVGCGGECTAQHHH